MRTYFPKQGDINPRWFVIDAKDMVLGRLSTTVATILSGNVSSTNVMLRAAEIAKASGTKRSVINMMQVPGGSESQQVLLQVRFAEVNRRILKEIGLNLIVNRQGWAARASTQQFTAPSIDDAANPGGIVFSDLLNLFFFSRDEGIGGIMRALEQTGAFQSLAEPNLIAYNGQEASFLAGGEFPVPVVQGTQGQVTVQFKEFGMVNAIDCRTANNLLVGEVWNWRAQKVTLR